MQSLIYLSEPKIEVPQPPHSNGFDYSRPASPVLDLRSDVVIPPTEEMWEAIHRVGFSGTPLNDDLIVKELENQGAELLGKEMGLFVPTCTVANLLAMMTLGARGTKVVLEKTSHIATSEEWGLAYVCGLVPHLVETRKGIMKPEQVFEAITNRRSLQTLRTSLLCIENSHTNSGGMMLSPQETRELAQIAKQYIASVHLDGARLFNTEAALKVPLHQLAEAADTVSVSLNKGLGAPMGAMLCGSAETIAAARTNARRIGAASIHKAGTMAAAAIVALNNRDHLADDHRRAKALAERLAGIEGLFIDLETVQTNLVKVRVVHAKYTAKALANRLAKQGILALERGEDELRFVLHRMIQENDVDFIVANATQILSD